VQCGAEKSIRAGPSKGAEATIPTHNVDAITYVYSRIATLIRFIMSGRKAVRRSGARHVCEARSVVCNSNVPQRFLSAQPR
jgi:hypothetical protein